MLKEILVPISDLRFIVMACSKCHTEITLDLKYKRDPNGLRQSATPGTCPVCDAMFDLQAQSGVDMLRKAYEGITEQKTAAISFRVKSDEISN